MTKPPILVKTWAKPMYKVLIDYTNNTIRILESSISNLHPTVKAAKHINRDLISLNNLLSENKLIVISENRNIQIINKKYTRIVLDFVISTQLKQSTNNRTNTRTIYLDNMEPFSIPAPLLISTMYGCDEKATNTANKHNIKKTILCLSALIIDYRFQLEERAK